MAGLPGQIEETAGTRHTLGVWDGQPEINPDPKSPTEGTYLDPSDIDFFNQLAGGVANANTVTGSTHSGGNTIDGLTYDVHVAGWAVGLSITDSAGKIPGGTTIASIAGDGLSATLSNNASASFGRIAL